jgi:hypothetical protein
MRGEICLNKDIGLSKEATCNERAVESVTVGQYTLPLTKKNRNIAFDRQQWQTPV